MNMMATVLILATCFADELPRTCPSGMDEDEFEFLTTEGGYVYKPGTGYGRFLFVNSQTRVPLAELEQVLPVISSEIFVEVKISNEHIPAEIVTEIVDQIEDENALVIYPEKKRATVNIAVLAKDNPDSKVFASRVRKEMMRAFSFLTGITGGGTTGHLMDIMSDMRRLDAAPEMLPGELVIRCNDFLLRSGVKPYVCKTYKEACEEGWAANPTNVWQRAIWDKVHAIPKNPMKIEFDPKKGR